MNNIYLIIKNKKVMIKLTVVAVTLGVALYSSISLNNTKSIGFTDPYLLGYDSITIATSPPAKQMYFYIKKYCLEYNIPEEYAFSLAYQETRYRGPLDSLYNHKQRSVCGALGPMQIMPSTANMIYGTAVEKNKLRSDIDLNVMISMKLLNLLHTKYQNWGLAFGAYNTGRPRINQYANRILNKQYVWINN